MARINYEKEENVFLLDEYSEFEAFLARSRFLSSICSNQNEKSSDYLDKDLDRRNVLYIYSQSSSYLDNYLDELLNNIPYSMVLQFPKKPKKLNKIIDVWSWLLDTFEEFCNGYDSNSLVNKLELQDFIYQAIQKDGNRLSLDSIENLCDLIDDVSGVVPCLLEPTVLGLQVASLGFTAAKASHDFYMDKKKFKELIKKQSGNESSIKIKESHPFDFFEYDLHNWNDIANKNNKNLVVFLKDFRNCFGDSGYYETLKNLIFEKNKNITWVIVNEKQPTSDLYDYINPNDIWNLSNFNLNQTRQYFEFYFKKNGVDIYRFHDFKKWCEEIYFFCGGNRSLVKFLAETQRDDIKELYDKEIYKCKGKIYCNFFDFISITNPPNYEYIEENRTNTSKDITVEDSLDLLFKKQIRNWLIHIFHAGRKKDDYIIYSTSFSRINEILEAIIPSDETELRYLCNIIYESRLYSYNNGEPFDKYRIGEASCVTTNIKFWTDSEINENLSLKKLKNNSIFIEHIKDVVDLYYLNPLALNCLSMVIIDYLKYSTEHSDINKAKRKNDQLLQISDNASDKDVKNDDSAHVEKTNVEVTPDDQNQNSYESSTRVEPDNSNAQTHGVQSKEMQDFMYEAMQEEIRKQVAKFMLDNMSFMNVANNSPNSNEDVNVK